MAEDKAQKKSIAPASRTSAWSLFGVLLVMGVLVTGSVSFCRQLAHSERYQVTMSRVVPAAGQTTAVLDHVDALDPILGRRDQWNIFDRDLSAVVDHAFATNPWVRGVSVKRKFPATVEVDVDLVEPFALAEWDVDQYVVIDVHGEILPNVDGLSLEALKDSPIIRAFPTEGPMKDRRRLKDEDFGWFASAVREGAAVIRDLLDHAYTGVFDQMPVKIIDVSNFGGRLSANAPEATLVTDVRYFDPQTGERPAMQVLWGRSSIHPFGPIELPVAKKIEHIETVLARRPRFQGVALIDVRFDDVYYRPVTVPVAEDPKTPKNEKR